MKRIVYAVLLLCAGAAAAVATAASSRTDDYGLRFTPAISAADRAFVLATIHRMPALAQRLLRQITPDATVYESQDGTYGAGGSGGSSGWRKTVLLPRHPSGENGAFEVAVALGYLVNETGMAVSVVSPLGLPRPDALSRKQAAAWPRAFATNPKWRRCYVDHSQPVPRGQTPGCISFAEIWAKQFASWALGDAPPAYARSSPFPSHLIARARFASMLAQYWRCRGVACGVPGGDSTTTVTTTTTTP